MKWVASWFQARTSYAASTTYAGVVGMLSSRYLMPGRDLAARARRLRRRHAGHPEQVVALVGGEHQRPAERGQHLPGRMRPAGLLHPDVVVDRDPGELGDLLAAQPRGAPPARSRAGPRRRPYPVAPRPAGRLAGSPRRGAEVLMFSSLPRAATARVVPLVPGSAGLSRRGGCHSVRAMTAKIALITGANKGIGFETARQLGAQGMTVLVGARDEERGQRPRAPCARAAPTPGLSSSTSPTPSRSSRAYRKWIEAEYRRA